MEIKAKDRAACSVHLSDDEKDIVIIDQRALPNEEVYLRIRDHKEMYRAIATLAVRGAPAIGIFAGYCVYVLSVHFDTDDPGKLCAYLKEQGDYLIFARPTAVNLGWAIKRMLAAADRADGTDVNRLRARLKDEAVAIHDEDIAMCRRIAEYGLSLIRPGDGILTHCNAGPLATSRYGTALGPILLGKERGIDLKVYADETRPLLQGARLTSYELLRAGVDVTLICDNMASLVMRNGWVQACFVGCDRIAANGDFANKIGTCGVAILAKHYGIPFYTLGPVSTIDMDCPTGEEIAIELRDGDEIRKMWYEKPMAPAGVACYNPAFDVTDHELVTAIVTDRGIVYPPFDKGLKELFENGKDQDRSFF
ncbi:MAG: S-methyl-5-thioribose-1-phosphate isomerase [Lachnospiraceae bacterium]|nr:S-methyl-5-thioribose-1-phosphate isomerase [Lachnospiraceae bacterium]